MNSLPKFQFCFNVQNNQYTYRVYFYSKTLWHILFIRHHSDSFILAVFRTNWNKFFHVNRFDHVKPNQMTNLCCVWLSLWCSIRPKVDAINESVSITSESLNAEWTSNSRSYGISEGLINFSTPCVGSFKTGATSKWFPDSSILGQAGYKQGESWNIGGGKLTRKAWKTVYAFFCGRRNTF